MATTADRLVSGPGHGAVVGQGIGQGEAGRGVWRGTVPSLLGAVRLWHLLSLDAPTVAVVWMLVFCGAGRGAALGGGALGLSLEGLALGLAVWLLYVGDRVLDARRGNGPLQARHRFHARHERGLGLACAAALMVLGCVMVGLPEAVRLGWLLLAVPMGLYALGIHVWRWGRMPKEMLVAVFFAIATALPGLLEGGRRGRLFGPECLLFAAVCWLDGLAIARWEHVAGRPALRTTGWGMRRFGWLCLGVALSGTVAGVAFGGAVPLLACGLSAGLLWLLDRGRGRFEAVVLRGLADATLLTPVLFWVALAGHGR